MQACGPKRLYPSGLKKPIPKRGFEARLVPFACRDAKSGLGASEKVPGARNVVKQVVCSAQKMVQKHYKIGNSACTREPGGGSSGSGLSNSCSSNSCPGAARFAADLPLAVTQWTSELRIFVSATS